MDEEQAVLDFFAKAENLPLALAVAEQTDKQREYLNNNLWCDKIVRMLALWSMLPVQDCIRASGNKILPEYLVKIVFPCNLLRLNLSNGLVFLFFRIVGPAEKL